jgi:2-polyprenyl-6-methoxyphenol hydroxylase-like FAD-dependent oxidoreductase
VVGAGPTGLILALILTKNAIPVRIIDKKPGPSDESRAIAVQARTLELYQGLGFAEEVIAGGYRIEKVHVREGEQEIAQIDLKSAGTGRSPFPFALAYPQDAHERLLIQKLEDAGVKVEWGVSLADFTQDETGVTAELEQDGKRRSVAAAFLCGCDGGHSQVRHTLGVPFVGDTYAQIFYVADAVLATPFSTDIYANIGSAGIALAMPVRGGSRRVIGIVPPDLTQKSDLSELSMEDVRPSAEAALGVRVEHTNWFATYRIHHRVADKFRVGRCFLVGDAGHLHSPAGGQGMNTGIGDAFNLAWKLAMVWKGAADESILNTYEAERRPFALTLVATTDRVFRFLAASSWLTRFLRIWVAPWIFRLIAATGLGRSTAFNTVSQLRIQYRDSPFSQGKAGRVVGGDRLPWVHEGDMDNIAKLGLGWQLHVYGTTEPDLADEAESLGLELVQFPFGAAAAQAGLTQDAAYLVRPDGYVSWVSAAQNEEELRGFVDRLSLRFARGET